MSIKTCRDQLLQLMNNVNSGAGTLAQTARRLGRQAKATNWSTAMKTNPPKTFKAVEYHPANIKERMAESMRIA
jgi:hypothetical protein